MAKKQSKALTDDNFREIMWEAMTGVFNGTLEPKEGEAIAKTGREILNLEKTKIQAHKAGLLVKNKTLLG